MKLTGQKNQCQACKRYFAKNYIFAKHRVGTFGKDRRCMTDDELNASFYLSADGFWRSRNVQARGVAYWTKNAPTQ